MGEVLAALRDTTPRKDNQAILNCQVDGYLISVGLNSFSNDHLISTHAHPDCLWFHAMAARGSHVVLCVHGKSDPSPSVLESAARLALKHSHSQARTVVVALLRDVHKPDGTGIGVWRSKRSTTLEVPE